VHGFAFTLVTISLQIDVDRCAGRRRATAQGLLSVAMSGMGCFIGVELSGMAGRNYFRRRWRPPPSKAGSSFGSCRPVFA
jgi:hypothetical protein